jgi:membrane-associated phospholipid phosphatase
MSLDAIAHRVTDFADIAVVLPLAFGIGLLFASSGWRRGALTWTAAIGAALGLIVLLKLRFFACADKSNPSGHTAAATAVYGALASVIVSAIWQDMRRSLAAALGVGLVLASIVGHTRLVLDQHSMPEVLVGGGIGVSAAIGFAVVAGSPGHAIPLGRLIVSGLALVFLLYGYRLSAEVAIQSMAAHVTPLKIVCTLDSTLRS